MTSQQGCPLTEVKVSTARLLAVDVAGMVKNQSTNFTKWKLPSKDVMNLPGAVEGALIGSTISNIKEPVEIGRIVRSFDPCVSCATHLIGSKGEAMVIEVLT